MTSVVRLKDFLPKLLSEKPDARFVLRIGESEYWLTTEGAPPRCFKYEFSGVTEQFTKEYLSKYLLRPRNDTSMSEVYASYFYEYYGSMQVRLINFGGFLKIDLLDVPRGA